MRVRLKTKLRWDKKDDTNPGEVYQTLMTSVLEVEEASRAQDSEVL